MNKRFALIALLLAALMLLSGCNLIGHDDELDGAQVVAKVETSQDTTEITKAEWEAYRDYLASYYQQYFQQNFGVSMQLTDDDIASYGEAAVEQLIESVVLEGKMKELGFEPLPEEDASDVESYADNMFNFYKMMIRYQNYPDLETVEEEEARLAALEEATGSEATPAEATPAEATPAEATPAEATPAEAVDTERKATVTNDQLDEMLVNDLNTVGYTRDYFVQNQTASVQREKIREKAAEGVEVTDEQVQEEFDKRVATQKESYDAAPAGYVTAENNGTTNYYVPEGYRGVKNLLIKFSDEKQNEISDLNSAISTANTTLSDAQKQLDDLKAEDTSSYDEATKAGYDEQVAALEETVATAQATLDESSAKLETVTAEAYDEILPTAQDVLARAQSGEDFDSLIETYGQDTGMNNEPNKSRGYLVCDGLSVYEQSFQDAAMALEKVGDVSAELVKTSYGYHILQYATDIAAGEVEYTDEIKSNIYDTMLSDAKDAAYEAAVTQWVSEAKVTTYPKVMK